MLCLKTRYQIWHCAIKQSAYSTRLLTMILYAYHFSPMCTSPTHLPEIYNLNNSQQRVQFRKFLIAQLPPLRWYFHRITSKYFPSNLFSNTLRQYSSFTMMDKNSHPYKTDNTILLYISIFIFLYRKCQDKILVSGGINKFNRLLGYPFFWKMLLHHWVSAAKLWRQCSGLRTRGTKPPVMLYHIPEHMPHPYHCKNL
jgi:hypothetical protein